MKTKDINLTVGVAAYDELPEADRRLIDAAREASRRAYAPYSHFSVGAAILLSNGEIVEGANQENVAYPSGICAERTAAFYAHSRYPDATFRKIAIAAIDTSGHEIPAPISPCGACRQVLLEYETIAGAPVEVLLAGKECIYLVPSVTSLLPLSFTEIV